MSVSLQGGNSVSLSKRAGTLTKMAVGLAWQERATAGDDVRADAMALVLGASGRVLDGRAVLFHKLDARGGVAHHTRDDRTGPARVGTNDSEIIKVDLTRSTDL
jgi:tellurium resistance protein TerD